MDNLFLKFMPYLKAMRIHHWIKNLLVLVPLIFSGNQANSETLLALMISFIAFSLVASSGYLLNDILDIDSDRNHPSKKDRPLAAGQISIVSSKYFLVALLALGFICAYQIKSNTFFLILSFYFFLSAFYSYFIKQFIIADIITLGVLYTLRIIAGGASIDVSISVWLLSFSMFIFLSLGSVKRLSELISNNEKNQIPSNSRAYELNDISILEFISLLSGYLSVLVLVFHIYTEPTDNFYSVPMLLWAICPIILYWITRTVIITHRGLMHYDPLVFAISDNASRLCAILIILILIAAKFL